MDYRGDWMNDTRGSLMMVAIIIATITFAAPGGVWQNDTIEALNGPGSNDGIVCVAGNAVLAYYVLEVEHDLVHWVTHGPVPAH
ncbi:hypothetical protein CDL15_Pgr003432 [Punica granatum]|uniref:PGG domain-containing protein n=1 Tax=Punica granatum TaxID=22663 RepID=A0A218X3K2_PUNGR|nr:hypothetical protein CDL15_Pgr003432 [Punica granatum]PKI31981.1 hypothetical protein CRG98_047627 [Punica granatum]